MKLKSHNLRMFLNYWGALCIICDHHLVRGSFYLISTCAKPVAKFYLCLWATYYAESCLLV